MSEGSLNEVKLIGRLGKDPDLRTMPSGDSVCNILLATSETYKKEDKVEKHTEWHNITFFNKRADNVAQYCKKGSRVFIAGKLHTSK
jgi:single-strand DNA-binding protein